MSEMNVGLAAELAECAAWADMMEAMPPAVRGGLQADGRWVGGALAIAAKSVPLATFNRAIGLGLSAPADTQSVTDLARHMRAVAAPVAQIQVAPFARGEAVVGSLQAAGLSLSPTRWAKMGRSTKDAPVVETALSVSLVGAEDAGDFAKAVLAGFGMPPFMEAWLVALATRQRWRCYVARDAGAVVGGGAMFVGERDVWLGIAATVPGARRQGGQGALIARRLADAAALDKPMAYTETGILDGPNPSLANMYRTGFKLLHERSNWVLKT